MNNLPPPSGEPLRKWKQQFKIGLQVALVQSLPKPRHLVPEVPFGLKGFQTSSEGVISTTFRLPDARRRFTIGGLEGWANYQASVLTYLLKFNSSSNTSNAWVYVVEIVQNFEILCGEQRYCRYFFCTFQWHWRCPATSRGFQTSPPTPSSPSHCSLPCSGTVGAIATSEAPRRCKRKTGVKYGGSSDVQR